MKKFAIAFSETGCEAVVEAPNKEQAIIESNNLVRYSSEHSEWPEFDLLKVVWEKSKYEVLDNASHKEFLLKYGCNEGGDYPKLTGELLVFLPTKGDQAVYIYETDHPAVEYYGAI